MQHVEFNNYFASQTCVCVAAAVTILKVRVKKGVRVCECEGAM